ncbi:unnamed protein product [Pleuronectes platessa]|uniref:Uncharacterized protein n=1 Tax=Pleuronectes platessa TaxID=8262 RepID=A0A9N7YMD9_PLEPL|nr:unnamed protein product [Pleuronectes platessa]
MAAEVRVPDADRTGLVLSPLPLSSSSFIFLSPLPRDQFSLRRTLGQGLLSNFARLTFRLGLVMHPVWQTEQGPAARNQNPTESRFQHQGQSCCAVWNQEEATSLY